jgi:coenzyme F420-0:L-glutamate ligase/coenzyme F420-1:gamma-L-glutamate ligase
MTKQISILAVQGIPEVKHGDRLGKLIVQALAKQRTALDKGDVIIVTQKVVSKAEGRIVQLQDIEPSALAIEVAKQGEKDPRQIEVVLRESTRIIRMHMGVVIAETRHGFKCANAGVDASNVGEDAVSLLPHDPDMSARQIADEIFELTSKRLAVIVSDTFGRPWREGATNVAIGISGMKPFSDYRGLLDPFGRELHSSVIAVADELASAAELVTGKLDNVPVAVIHGFTYEQGNGTGRDLVRPKDKDLFP